MRAFRAKGGNAEVNKRLAKNVGRFAPSTRPDGSMGKPDISEYIRRKYQAIGPPESGPSYSSQMPTRAERMGQPQGPSPYPGNAGPSDTVAGRTCFQGVCFAEVMGIEISDERARDLRILGSMFLSLSATMSLGTITAEPTSIRRGST